MSKLKDVAELSGVSLGTVDRIVHNRGRFSEETARRVRDAMLKLNYKPDIRARNLSLSRKCHIAVIMPFTDSNSGYWNLPYQGMQKALKELSASHVSADFHLFNENDRKDLGKTLKKIKGKSYDAYIAAPLLH
ncbi:MAG TPA: LacI family DNA-binding transcriptional regulator, partial [Spirochaetota bacterium]|nr:LacI family DNA-binding transcriptional regulator [Spirochaetota bacterium]